MSEHHAAVTVHAPVHQVYTLFTHFNDFPKFMRFVKEVTYYDEQRSHWVAHVFGDHEWDAVNEDWIPDQQIGWRSTSGLENTGKVAFMPLNEQQTNVDIYITYTPPMGVFGATLERLGIDSRFDTELQEDLNNFARMVEQAPADALDPMSSHYLFHSESATAKGAITERQRVAMEQDPMMSAEALQQRKQSVQQEVANEQQQAQEREVAQRQRKNDIRQSAEQQWAALAQQAELNRQAAQQQAASEAQQATQEREPHPVYDTIGGRNASQQRTVIGDQDAQSERFPSHHEDPMGTRTPSVDPQLTETQVESPWRSTIQGQTTEGALERQEQAAREQAERKE